MIMVSNVIQMTLENLQVLRLGSVWNYYFEPNGSGTHPKRENIICYIDREEDFPPQSAVGFVLYVRELNMQMQAGTAGNYMYPFPCHGTAPYCTTQVPVLAVPFVLYALNYQLMPPLHNNPFFEQAFVSFHLRVFRRGGSFTRDTSPSAL